MRDLKYIIKKVIIGVGIALCLMLIKGNFLIQTFASTITQSVNSYYFIDPTESGISVLPSSSWRTWTDGNISAINYDFGNIEGVYEIHVTFSYRNAEPYTYGPNNLFTLRVFANNILDTSASSYITCNYNYNYSSATCDMYANGVNLSSKYLIVRADVYHSEYIYNPEYLVSGSIDITSLGSDINIEDITNQFNGVINSNQQNSQNIINNQNQNTQNIINNQNENTDKQIKSQEVCNFIDNNSIIQTNSFLDSDGSIGSNSQYGITDYIPIQQSRIISTTVVSSSVRYACFYNINKTLISCIALNSMFVDTELTIPNNSAYFRSSIQKNNNRPTFNICTSGNQAINNAINSDDVSVANSKASSFFNDFSVNSHGLSGIITSPLRLINSLSSSSCSSLSLPLPFVNQSVVLPCMSTIYSQHFSTFLTLYRLITDGIISYWVLIKIFGHIKGMQSPDDDRIEVLDL